VGSGPSGARFTIAGGTAYDVNTRLTWQRTVAPSTYTWDEAKAYCPSVTSDGGGWRLPSLKELATLVDNTRYDPAIDILTFLGTDDSTWSVTAMPSSSASAWNVGFFLGATDSSLPATSQAQVRCVR